MIDAAMPDEQWLPVVGYEGSYEVSDLGRVRSLDRVTIRKNGSPLTVRGRVLRPCRDPYGYYQVNLCAGTEQHISRVHRLVAAAFIGPCPAGAEVRHGPGGFLDNRVVNLCYGSRRDNALDKRRDGTHHQAKKSVCPRGHPLEAPNLIPAIARRGFRSCLACDRGRGVLRHARSQGITLSLQVEADRHYEIIMASAS